MTHARRLLLAIMLMSGASPASAESDLFKRFAPNNARTAYQAPLPTPATPASAASDTVQLVGSRVTFKPIHGMITLPGSGLHLLRGDQVTVQVVHQGRGDQFHNMVGELGSLAWQRAQGLTQVEVFYRPVDGLRRLIGRGVKTDGRIAMQQHFALIADDKWSALIVASTPQHSFASNAALTGQIERMISSARLAADVLENPNSFSILPPAGYVPVGAHGGKMQSFARGEDEALFIARVERGQLPQDLHSAGRRFVTGLFQSDFSDVKTLEEAVTKSGRWDVYELEATGNVNKTGIPTWIIARVQMDRTTGEAYIMHAIHMAPSQSWRETVGHAFASIRAVN